MAKPEIPAGFIEVSDIPGGFNNAFRPFYMHRGGEYARLGFVVGERHTNSVGICHGGAIMTFADIALGLALIERVGRHGSAPTLSLSFDFISMARCGEWLESAIHLIELKRTIGFISGVVVAQDRRVVARASGSFRLPRS